MMAIAVKGLVMPDLNTGVRSIPLGRNAKFGHLDVDTERFNETVHMHVYVYGLRQILNDAIADKTDDNDKPLGGAELVAKAQKRLDTLYSGELRTRRDTAEPADPIEAELFRMIRASLVAAAKQTPQWANVPKGTKDRPLWVLNTRAVARHETERDWPGFVAGALERMLDGGKKLRAAAARIVKEREAVEGVEI